MYTDTVFMLNSTMSITNESEYLQMKQFMVMFQLSIT